MPKMTTEELNYAQKLQYFKAEIIGSTIFKVVLSIDEQPAFDLSRIPFQFEYSYFTTLITSSGNFTILPSLVSDSYETFWIEIAEKEPAGNKAININSIVKGANFKCTSSFALPYKIIIELEAMELLLYCGDIYEAPDKSLTYKGYDEMILVFRDKREGEKFERLIVS
jgi:hypothetical protein